MVAKTIRSRSPASRPASARARRAASAPSAADDWPLRASRRSAIPVRCRIHSSVVSMNSESRSLVTRPSGTYMPEPRTTVWMGGTSRSYRRAPGRPLGERGQIDVAGDVVGGRGPAEDPHARGCVDPHAAGVLVLHAEGGEHGADDGRLVGLEVDRQRAGGRAARLEARDRDVAGRAGVEEIE